MSNFKEFTKGLIKENPSMVMLLGMCPTLAITTMASNGVGMGLSTTFVLVCSNIVISLLKKIIPDTVRLPAYIVIVAGFVTFVSLMLQAFLPDIYSSLGMYLSLITVNCIILGRAEMFASKNKVIPSILDGLGMGLGFTLTLVLVGSLREIFGSVIRSPYRICRNVSQLSFYNIRHMTGSRSIKYYSWTLTAPIYALDYFQNSCHEITCIQGNCLTRFNINL